MTAADLNRLFAERVAGWKRNPKAPLLWKIPSGARGFEPPDYLHDPDAVIAELEKHLLGYGLDYSIGCREYTVALYGDGKTIKCSKGVAPTFCEAAMKAMLKAKGVEV
jgi:hypothetical protein